MIDPQTRPRANRRHLARGGAMRRWTLQRLLIVLTAVLGCGILLYPTAADWFADRAHAREIKSYTEEVAGLGDERTQQLLADARKYNDELPEGPLRDPYVLNEKGETVSVGSGSAEYLKTLSTLPDGVMGQVRIPGIDVNIPLYHGTDEETLAKGAGHIFGSSLPVGGAGTHSVITAHSGLVNAKLFTDLSKVGDGDVFTVSVLNETLYYKVDRIQTVLPGETESLRQVDGHDYLTLITCTPTGVNSHRLLVRGERIPAPADTGQEMQAGNTKDPGFPWWAVVFAGSAAGAVVITRPRGTQASAAA